ncbi:alpha/beta hydrolase [Salipiger thiooxidans]|uniref:alpha/beta hydrolase n=1 Tax=Salipiger thiooxidans TaxID=282683 RepID=UPI001A8F518A|nr:alpha/beta hydrolase [Salipiger thiooxidans]MBN8190287.1 alpha/beta hydrolase [Salipiger thiooxidans]
MALPTRHGEKLSFYDFGRTAVQVCRADPRFSYCAYVPESYDESSDRRYRLIVAVHGTRRDNAVCRDAFIDLAERHQMIVLAPLFPGGITGPRELGSYKKLRDPKTDGPDYDTLLLAMIQEIGEIYRLDAKRFCLFGFSGGAHFAHRFLYSHPDRLTAVSIAAPGIVTLLDDQADWPAGIRNMSELFGAEVDVEALRRVSVHLVVGADDLDTWEIAIPPGHAWWQPAFDTHGPTRIDRLRLLDLSLRSHGVEVRFDIVPSAQHQQDHLLPAAKAFFSNQL